MEMETKNSGVACEWCMEGDGVLRIMFNKESGTHIYCHSYKKDCLEKIKEKGYLTLAQYAASRKAEPGIDLGILK
ncbi:hypothetical protein ACEU07_14595 [Chromobacterium violaceum]|uniref:hypothetical protein n=1 Tax=Chromobacterium violaceum TaxID=536 RepID=UPI0035A6FD06